ncbi:MAG: polysaccharide deacetylase family protein [Acidimicrobiia bacterium]
MTPPFPGPRLLIYHQVGTDLGREMEVATAVFSRQLDWLTARGTIVDLEDAVARRGSPESSSLFVLTFDDGYADMFSAAYPQLRQRGLPFTLYLTSGPIQEASPQAPGAEPLTWDQAREMYASGLMTVGAHTHSHPDLRSIDAASIADELRRSDELIEEQLGVRPLHFAYPKGYWAAPAEKLVAARYDTAVLGAGPPLTQSTNLYRLSRIPVQRSDGVYFFARKMRRGMRLEEWARCRIKGYRNPS